MPNNPVGVEKALKMRQMFMADGFRCRLDIEPNLHYRDGVIAVLQVKDEIGMYLACYYFRPDGSYFRGSN